MPQQIKNLKGFRDFLPKEKMMRDFITSKIIESFENFGFAPIQTPTLEQSELLLGKYGEEADRLIYSFKDKGDRSISLRYDQTVPSARIITQYQNDLPKYFRRYQIQSVFRSEKPQKGRFREFTQCDIDIFGSRSNLADAEIVACSYAAIKNIGFHNVKIKINDRQILFEALQKYAAEFVSVFSIIQSIDKLDKLSIDAVINELILKGLDKIEAHGAITDIKNSKESKNLLEVMMYSKLLGVPEDSIVFTPELARGLDYYTGVMYEIIIPEYGAGSCAGGGRYDKLIDQLIGVDIPATGIAFGFDRLVEAASELGLLEQKDTVSEILITIFDKTTLPESLELAKRLRVEGINTEVFPEPDKNFGKQIKYADSAKFKYVIIIGPEEIESGVVRVKSLFDGYEKIVQDSQIIQYFLDIKAIRDF